MMRLDKFLVSCNICSRSEAKKIIKKGLITVNNCTVCGSDIKIDESKDIICYQEKQIVYEQYVYYILNKPAGYITATMDKADKTVLDLFPDKIRHDLFPVGRLDKDTTGLLIITNDGALSHHLTSPSHHVDKTYLVTLKNDWTKDDTIKMQQGVDIGEKYPTKPANVTVLDKKLIELTIFEGKFHQVKRMMQAVDNEVIALKRTKMGKLILPDSLAEGSFIKVEKSDIL